MTQGDPARAKVLARIQRLLAMSVDTSSPNEAGIAAARASKLMLQHNVSRAEALAAAPHDQFVAEHACSYRTYSAWRNQVAQGVANLHDAQVMVTRPGRVIGGQQCGHLIVFAGIDPDPAVCVYTMGFLVREMARWADAYVHRLSADVDVRAALRSFRLGAARGISTALKTAKTTQDAQYADHPGVSAVMVVKGAVVSAYVEERSAKRRLRQADPPHAGAFRAGFTEGSKVTLTTGIAENA